MRYIKQDLYWIWIYDKIKTKFFATKFESDKFISYVNFKIAYNNVWLKKLK